MRLFILVLAGQQSFPLVRQVVDPTAMLKTSSALAGFLLAPQAALAQAPAIPAATVDDGQTTLTWAAPNPPDSSIQSYKVRYRKRGESAWTEAAISGSDSTTTSHTVTGLDNGYIYSLEICAVRAGTCSEYSTTAYVAPRTTSTSAPAKPTGLSATGGDRSVTLSWTASTDRSIRGYQYQQRSNGTTGAWTWTADTTSRTTSYKITGLTNGTPYSFKIRAVNHQGGPATDGWATATPAVPTPGFTVSPTSLTIDEGSSDTYTVKLDAAPSSNVVVTVGGESGDVTVSGSPLTFTPANYSSPQTVTVNAGADADTTDDTATLTHSYTGGGDTYSSISIDSVTVTVTDTGTTPTPGVSTNDGTSNSGSPSGGGGTNPSTPSTPSTTPSSPSTPARTTDPSDPAFQLPSDPAAVTEGEAIILELRSSSPLTGTHAVSLTFSDRNSSGFTASDIPGSLGPRSFNAEFGSSPSRSGRITIPTSRDSDVEGREHYRIKLNAGSGYSLGSATTADGTLLDPLPAKPTGLTATPGHGQVTLNWDDPNDASITGWQVQYKEGDGSYGNWIDIPNSAATTSHTVTGLKDGIRYAFRLRAVNAVGAGEASDAVMAITLHADDARASKARKASLVGLSRATLSSATDVIGSRISGELTTTPDSDGSIGEQALGIVEDLLGISATALPSSLSMEGIGEQLWHQTFQLTPPAAPASATADGQRAQADDTTAEQQRNWALWGAGDLRLFNGDDAQEQISYEGNLKTAWVGIDQQFSSPWRAGVAASFSMGESDYTYERISGETAGGSIKSRLTAFYPYGAVQLNERLRLWGTAGVGFGELRHQEATNATDSQEQQGDLRMQLALVGFEQQLSSIGTWDFSLAGDLGLIKTTSQWPDHSGLEDLSITLTRARLGVDSSFPLSESTRGYVNLRGRMDGGELQMGAAEAVAGLQ